MLQRRYFHGCGAKWFYPYEIAHLNFQGWADANDIVVVFPYLMGWADHNVSHITGQQRSGCYDGYGQTGANYALSTGSQMATVRRMIAGFGGR